MNFLYEVPGMSGWAIMLFVTFTLIAFNEFGRTTKWGAIFLFLILPMFLNILIWPKTPAPRNEYGTGILFNWVKTYSALVGCLGFMAIRYIPSLEKKKWVLFFPAVILVINILEACIRDFQVYSYGLWEGGYAENLWQCQVPGI